MQPGLPLTQFQRGERKERARPPYDGVRHHGSARCRRFHRRCRFSEVIVGHRAARARGMSKMRPLLDECVCRLSPLQRAGMLYGQAWNSAPWRLTAWRAVDAGRAATARKIGSDAGLGLFRPSLFIRRSPSANIWSNASCKSIPDGHADEYEENTGHLRRDHLPALSFYLHQR